MRVHIRPMLPTDAVDIRLRRWDAHDVEGMDMASLGMRLAWDSLRAVAAELPDGAIVACGGVMPVEGSPIGDFWALTSALLADFPLAFLRTARDLLQTAEEHGLVRLQALVLPENGPAIRFIEHLGFRREGLLRRCGPNLMDRYLYARVS